MERRNERMRVGKRTYGEVFDALKEGVEALFSPGAWSAREKAAAIRWSRATASLLATDAYAVKSDRAGAWQSVMIAPLRELIGGLTLVDKNTCYDALVDLEDILEP